MSIHEQLIHPADDTFQDHRQAADAESCFDQERIKVEDQSWIRMTYSPIRPPGSWKA
jgi:hypothetical protein